MASARLPWWLIFSRFCFTSLAIAFRFVDVSLVQLGVHLVDQFVVYFTKVIDEIQRVFF